MFLLWHPSLTAINLSYTFPILETSATALCGTTGILFYCFQYPDTQCMAYLPTYIYHQNQSNVGKYTIHWVSGIHLFLANWFFFHSYGSRCPLNWFTWKKRLQHRTVSGWYCRYHRNVQSVIQVVHWVIWESINTHQWYPYLHDVTTTSQQSR